MEKGISWEEIRKQRNCLKRIPSPKPSFLRDLLAMKQEMVWQVAVLTGLFVPSQRIQLTRGPQSPAKCTVLEAEPPPPASEAGKVGEDHGVRI